MWWSISIGQPCGVGINWIAIESPFLTDIFFWIPHSKNQNWLSLVVEFTTKKTFVFSLSNMYTHVLRGFCECCEHLKFFAATLIHINIVFCVMVLCTYIYIYIERKSNQQHHILIIWLLLHLQIIPHRWIRNLSSRNASYQSWIAIMRRGFDSLASIWRQNESLQQAIFATHRLIWVFVYILLWSKRVR